MAGSDAAVLGKPAVHRLAHEPALHPIHRVHEDPVTRPPPFDPGTDLRHLARDVETGDHREGEADAGHAPAREDVVVVERGRADPDDDLALARGRVRNIRPEREHLRAAVAFDDECLHLFSFPSQPVRVP